MKKILLRGRAYYTFRAIATERWWILKAQHGEEKYLTFLAKKYAPVIRSAAHQVEQLVSVQMRLTHEDLAQEGYDGLLCAIWNFNHSYSNGLWVYAQHYVMNRMMVAYARDRKDFDLPTSGSVLRQLAMSADSATEHGEDTDLEVHSDRPLWSSAELCGGTELSDEFYGHWHGLTQNRIPHEPRSEEIQPFLLDDEDVVEMVMASLDAAMLHEAMKSLSERKAFVLARRYGLKMTRAYTLEELGEMLSVSKERVRQIQREAEAELLEILDPTSEEDMEEAA